MSYYEGDCMDELKRKEEELAYMERYMIQMSTDYVDLLKEYQKKEKLLDIVIPYSIASTLVIAISLLIQIIK